MNEPIDAGTFAEVRELLLSAGDDAYPRFVREYVAGGRRSLAAIRTALAAGDAAATESAAHSLKGASANIGARELCELCRRIEAAAGLSGLGGLADVAGEAEREFARVRTLLEGEAGAGAPGRES